jgi:poly(A) polymerase
MKTLESLLIQESRRLKIPIWWVGGPVRDELLKRPWLDGDVACKGAQRLAKSISRRLSAKLIVLDERYRIYRVIPPSDEGTLDVAELQGKTIQDDLSRRDFSINAMARRVGETTVIDPWNGTADLRRRKIRALSQRVLKEDPIRRLRAFRFSAQLGFSIEAKTLAWIRKGSLQTIAAERIREEFLKLLSARAAGPTLEAMDRAGLLIELVEELEACRWSARSFYGKGGVLKHSLNTVKNLEWLLYGLSLTSPRRKSGASSMDWAPTFVGVTSKALSTQSYLQELIGGHPRSAWLKLGALLHDIGKPATAQKIKGRLRFFGHEETGADMVSPLARRLRLSRQETQLIRQLVKHHMRLGGLAAAAGVTPKAYFRYWRDLEGEGAGMILVSLADHFDYIPRRRWGKNTDPVERLARKLLAQNALAPVTLPRLIDGHWIMRALKLKPSPLIGKILEQVQDAQADGKIKTKKEALKFIKALGVRS